MDKSKVNDEEWAKLAAVLKKIPGSRRATRLLRRWVARVAALLWLRGYVNRA